MPAERDKCGSQPRLQQLIQQVDQLRTGGDRLLEHLALIFADTKASDRKSERLLGLVLGVGPTI
ncbi:MAG: hypothetical protein ACK2TX_02725 [Anaerolineales bacterium]